MNHNFPYSTEELLAMPYCDFVGLINQWNVLPGAYSTLSKWRVYGEINSCSRVLEIACTTGFSSRELAAMCQCTGIGLDLSLLSVNMAKYNQLQYADSERIEYNCGNIHEFNCNEKFSHIIVGASLKFISEPQRLIKLIPTWLFEGGKLLASPFFVTEPIPAFLLNKARSIFGITPTTESYKDVMSLYSEFEILFEERCELIPETLYELEHYCKSTISRTCTYYKIEDEDVYQVLFERLYEIRKMSNELREYQGYTVLVLRYRQNIFPNRFVELF